MAVADGKPRTDEFAQLRKLFGRFNSAADPARLRLIALTLVFLHERDPAGWAAALRPRYQVRSGDLLCVRTGSIGRVGLVAAGQEGWIFGTGLICIRPAQQVDPQFLCFYFTLPAVTDWFTLQARQSTAIASISAQVLGTLPISLPPLAAQREIGRSLATLNDKIEAHQRICQTTAELRDALLPLLLTGQMSLPDSQIT